MGRGEQVLEPHLFASAKMWESKCSTTAAAPQGINASFSTPLAGDEKMCDKSRQHKLSSGNYWSSSEKSDNSGNAWFVYLANGYTDYFGKGNSLSVRCAR